ncbi:MAG: energy-coupling factor ABC transporter permease, partial [Gemmataceae bacterium]|nr:energy-coupling factor ABC transporter permease [Gemmataceae bacterium]
MGFGLFALHLSDGVLSWPWLLGGFLLIGALAAVACWRLDEDDVPRVALLAAAFFVASSIHVKLGPTSVHLLLNGLVGVMLGVRAPLAILLGVTLQALLLAHGGLSAIGVNACVEALPALAVAGLFPLMHGAQSRVPRLRLVLLGLAALAWAGCAAFAVGVLWTQPLSRLVRLDDRAGLLLSVGELEPALAIVLHPATLALVGLFVVAVLLLERKAKLPAEFPLGFLAGTLAVLGAVLLAGVVLLLDGAEKWGVFVSAVLVAHLPLALLEGGLLGMMVGFLARVKPSLIGLPRLSPAPVALLVLLLAAPSASAHGLEGKCELSADRRKATVTLFYETGEAPKAGRVRVFDEDGEVLAEGETDKEGRFAFDNPGRAVRIEGRSEGGHAVELKLTAGEMWRPPGNRLAEIMAGLGLLAALAALAMAWRNARRLRRLEERLGQLTATPQAEGITARR